MDNILKSKKAVIVGGSRGIGKVIAMEFARQGCDIVIAGRSIGDLIDATTICNRYTDQAYWFQMDVSDFTQGKGLVKFSLEKLGSFDILVNCAGIHGAIGPFADVDLNDWSRAVHVNLLGSASICQAVLPHMKQRKSGKILLMSGGGATAPMPNFSAYAASKAGLVRFVETLAIEVKEDNIQVNAIAPGMVDTTLQDRVLEAGEKAGDEYQKITSARASGKGFVSPQIAAELSVFLASDLSGQLTGKLISAPHDPWKEWGEKAGMLNKSPLFTLRRIDPHTIRSVIEQLKEL